MLMKIEPSKSGEGWYWSLTIDGGIYADGECATASQARDRAHAEYQKWNLNRSLAAN